MSQHCWLSQGVKVPRAASSPRATHSRDCDSPSAAAAASLLNYINRPPSSVIFYYTGKKWAGQVKKCISLCEHHRTSQPDKVASAFL